MSLSAGRLPLLTLLASTLPALAQIHRTPVEGRWFPAEPAPLARLLDISWTAAARRAGVAAEPRRGLAALIAPHAGLEYSGIVAAGAYRLIPGALSPRTIIVLAFSHRAPVDGVVTVKTSSFDTPAGTVRVDEAALHELGFPAVEESLVCDHSLENQLPFLRRAVPEAAIVPLYVGQRLSEPVLRSAAKKLAARIRRTGDLLIASSDFTHYGEAYGHTPFPADADLASRLRARAEDAFETIGSLNVPAFDRYLAATGDTICGRDPIRLLMAALSELHGDKLYMTTADYMTSASVKGADPKLNVGYAALAFYPAASFQVGPPAQRILLGHARDTLEAMVNGRSFPAPASLPNDFHQRTGAFVTIRKGKELRGCVGALSPQTGLLATIADRTRAAARSDPRFPPLTSAEFPVSLEVSLLTPLRRLYRWQDWRPGQGAVLTRAGAGGLLLPQVAVEMGWSREQFLEGLSRKAGLEPQAYRDGRAKLFVFDAQVFGE